MPNFATNCLSYKMSKKETYFHKFKGQISHLDKPATFTFPFYYEPHPLSLLAASELQNYLHSQTDFSHNFGLDKNQSGLIIGKMFGVLVVQNNQGEIGYLAACSGKLAETNTHRHLVPPVFDLLETDSFYLQEETIINRLNREIEQLEADPMREEAKDNLERIDLQNKSILAAMRLLHKQNKNERKNQRATEKNVLSISAYAELEIDLIKQSYRDQHDYDVLKADCKSAFHTAKEALDNLENEIEIRKQERKTRSATLQKKLFDQYQFLNARGEHKDVLQIFKEANAIVPPAGAGECAAPKLLQYAFLNSLTPLCMAEFWWGASPASEVRKHGNFYPACRGKCEPILGHMLQGLHVDPSPIRQNQAAEKDIDIIFEDTDIIVINKPTEMLSVPGIAVQDSVQTRILARNPEITGPVIIHRLDMSTSGILVLAKHKDAHQFIQNQFITHTIEKRYTALLAGIIPNQEGLIDLPLRVDLDDRPRQVVCYKYGKPAQTKYKVVNSYEGKTKVHFFPLTGRTHQLRVHSAHHLGLNTPIVGDDLYGTRAERLHLHAGHISFIHPRTKVLISFEVADPF